MAGVKLEVDKLDDAAAARVIRKLANQYNPWPPVRAAVFWMVVGGSTVAAMGYGDVHFCIGSCADANIRVGE